MSNRTLGHNRNPSDHGAGWTGVTDDDKRWAGGRAPDGANAAVRLRVAVQNCEDVREKWGTGHWTGQTEVCTP